MENKIKKTIIARRWMQYLLVLVAGLFLGWLFFHSSASQSPAAKTEAHSEGDVWTCSMDPQVRQDHPGKCPICGMDLIKVKVGETVKSDADPDAVMMSDEAMALANIQTETVGSAGGNKEIRLFGKIQPDQRLQESQSAYVAGRIERLMISAVGDRVGRGQILAVIYSPELYTAEQELVSALGYPNVQQRNMLVEAAVEKLRLLNIPMAQINQVIKTRKASPYVPLKANTSGTVIVKNVNPGDYVKQGDVLLQVANLSRVWATFQAYEGDLPFIKRGQTIQFTAEALPGRTFTGRVSFVDPVLNAQTRTAGVRVELSNPSGIFKPEMLIVGNAAAQMKQTADQIVIPKSSVLWTGKRSVVYVKMDSEEQPMFMLRQITLGATLPDGYVVLDGLAEGEEIVTNGAFAIDASAQLDGKKSMMNQ